MVFAWTQDLPIDETDYAWILDRLSTRRMEGLILHLVVRTETGLRYTDVWESREACDKAFEEVVHPAVHAMLAESGRLQMPEPVRTELDVVDVTTGGFRVGV